MTRHDATAARHPSSHPIAGLTRPSPGWRLAALHPSGEHYAPWWPRMTSPRLCRSPVARRTSVHVLESLACLPPMHPVPSPGHGPGCVRRLPVRNPLRNLGASVRPPGAVRGRRRAAVRPRARIQAGGRRILPNEVAARTGLRGLQTTSSPPSTSTSTSTSTVASSALIPGPRNGPIRRLENPESGEGLPASSQPLRAGEAAAQAVVHRWPAHRFALPRPVARTVLGGARPYKLRHSGTRK